MRGKSALVLLSGGLDSTVALWWAKRQGYDCIRTLSFSYGSREERVNLEVSRGLSGSAGAEHFQLDLDVLRKVTGGKSALLGAGEIPRGLDGPELDATRAVWVPARNLVMISVAASLAETIGGSIEIVVGLDKEEARTFPDNSGRFVDSMNLVLKDAVLEGRVGVVAPLIEMDKRGIIKLGAELGAPIELSCSCYRPSGLRGKTPVHCGECQSCILRNRGFRMAGIDDPTVYEVEPS
jgi:7-cyano-7-deazaguanine synthase